MKKLLLKLWNFIMRKARKLDTDIDRLLPVVANVVQVVKMTIFNPAFDIAATVVKSLIPGELDDLIIDKTISLARKHIPEIALRLQLIDRISKVEDPREQLYEIFGELHNASPQKWQKFCTELAQQITFDMADGEISWGEAGVYVELYYKTYIKE